MIDSNQKRKAVFSLLPVLGVLLAGATTFLAATPPAIAGTPSGPIACSLLGTPLQPGEDRLYGVRFWPLVAATSKNVGVKVNNNQSECDPSAVVGADLPITRVAVSIYVRMQGMDCSNFLSTSEFGRSTVRLRWNAIDGNGDEVRVAVSQARILDAGFDPDSRLWTIRTHPIEQGAFVEQTVTIRLGLDPDDPASEDTLSAWLRQCPNTGTRFRQLNFGEKVPSTLEVN